MSEKAWNMLHFRLYFLFSTTYYCYYYSLFCYFIVVVLYQLINIYFHDEDKCLFISYLIKTFLLSLSNQRPPAKLKRIYDLCSNAFGHCSAHCKLVFIYLYIFLFFSSWHMPREMLSHWMILFYSLLTNSNWTELSNKIFSIYFQFIELFIRLATKF